MATKVIGLDFGHTSVKAAILKGTYRGFDAVDFLKRELPLDEIHEPEPATATQSVAEFDATMTIEPVPVEEEADVRVTLRDLQLREAAALLDAIDTDDATVVAAVPSPDVSTWVVEVPFTQSRQITQVLPAVLEEKIPFDMDDLVVHSHPLESGPTALDGDPGTRLFCAMARHQEIQEMLGELGEIGVDPRFIPVDSGALVNLVRFVPFEGAGQAVIVMDVGHNTTKLCVVVDGVPRLLRTLDWGGRQIDAALQETYRFDDGEVAAYKARAVSLVHAAAPVPSDDGGDDEVQRMVEVTREATRPLLALLRTTLIAFEDEFGQEVDRIYVCGGGSELRGFNSFLAEDLGVEIQDLPLSASGGGAAEPGAEHAMAFALALRGLAAGKPQQVDFRIGRFAYRRDIQRMQRVAAVAVALVALLVIAGLGLSVFKAVRLQAKDVALMSEIRGTVMQTFPDVSESALVTSGAAVSVFTTEMEVMNAKMALIDPANQVTAFDRFRDLSKAIPKDHKIDVDSLEITAEAIKLRANTDKFETVDKIESACRARDGFEQCAAHDKVKGREGTTRFELTIPLVELDEE
jgi:Tfp pilus assembly PilM family ATPase